MFIETINHKDILKGELIYEYHIQKLVNFVKFEQPAESSRNCGGKNAVIRVTHIGNFQLFSASLFPP